MGAVCRRGEVVNGGSVNGECRGYIFFSFVDGGIGRRIDNGIGLEIFYHIEDGIGIGNV